MKRTLIMFLVFFVQSAFAGSFPVNDSPDSADVLYWSGESAKSLNVACGRGEVILTFDTGEVIFTEGCNPSAASKEFWERVGMWAQIENRLITPKREENSSGGLKKNN